MDLIKISTYLYVLFFITAGVNHFLNPFTNRYDDKGKKVSSAPVFNPFKKEFYTQMVRDNFEPWDENKNYLSG